MHPSESDSTNYDTDTIATTLDIDELPTLKRWQKIVTVDSTAKLLRQYPTPESPQVLSEIRNANLSRLNKAYQWSATKPLFSPISAALKKFTQYHRLLVALSLIGVSTLGGLSSWGLLTQNAQGHVNIFWWLLAFLGWPLLLLTLWVILFSFPINASAPVASILEHLIRSAYYRIRHWTTMTPVQEQVTSSAYAFFQEPNIGRWFSAALLHSAWLLYLCGGTLVLIIKLSFEHYVFVWQTSFIPIETFISLIQNIGFLPNMIGFDVPNNSLIATSQWTGTGGNELATKSWASFMIGCAITYGIIPRLFFWLLSYLTLRYRLNVAKLTPNNPHYGNYLRLLMPNIESSVGGMVITNEHTDGIVIRQPFGNQNAKIHWLRYESMINLPFSLRQAYSNSILLIDVDDLDSHDKAVREVSQLDEDDAYAICVAVNISQVPDEGFKQFIERLLGAAQVRVVLLLTGTEIMSRQGEKKDIEPRIQSWQQTAAAAQLQRNDCILMEGISPEDAYKAITQYLRAEESTS